VTVGWRVAAVAAVLAVLTTLALSGCGDVPDGSASGVATNYFRRLGDRDFTGACQLLTDDLKVKLGDCTGTLRRQVESLPVPQRIDLGGASVRHTVSHGNDSALVYTRDVQSLQTVTTRVKGTPSPKTSWLRSMAAYNLTNGHGLVLTKVGGAWKVSDCGL
jgi:hypothetical protein